MQTQTPSFSRLDTVFAQFLSEKTPLQDAEKTAFETLVKHISAQQNQGHNCLEVSAQETALLLKSEVVSVSIDTAFSKPLVLEKQRLYLQRYWHYEHQLAQQIKALTQYSDVIADIDTLLNVYFPILPNEMDWQREAAKKAVSERFCIITGGPGTGKTTTVVKILALLQHIAQTPLHIALAAPTGKAAMRLQEAMGQNKAQLMCDEWIKSSIPETVTTVHRLLGTNPESAYFRHHKTNPLAYDVIVIDEVSMVDVALMAKLVDSLNVHTRLILLGDKDQLASVESGAVLADLTAALPKHTIELKKSYRFDNVIKTFAVQINQQQAELAWETLQNSTETISLLNDDISEYAAHRYINYLEAIQYNKSFLEIYDLFMQFQVLCSNRQGKSGVEELNTVIEKKLVAKKYLIENGLWYIGRPIMITQNHAGMNLYNGDIGICLQENNQLMAFFKSPDGSIKKYLPSRLPAHETVFAMTIHKSQGSEFNEILIVLPDMLNPILTKELLYTAITRAKKVIKLAVNQAIFIATVQQKVKRTTGLMEKLQ